MDRRNNRGRRRRLIPAIRHGKLETARELINSYELPCSESSPKGYDLLCDALNNKHSEVAKLLLTSGSAVNSKENNYQSTSETPLHFAVINGDIEIMKMLLVRRANMNAQNIYGQTPLHKAIEKNDQVEIIELLLKHEADVNVKDRNDQTPLYVAIKNNRLEIIELLLKHNADVNVKDEGRNTPLFYAIQNPNLKITKLLLDNGANVKDDPKLLNIAVKRECPEIVELLLQHNADVNATDENGNTALLLNVCDIEDCYKYRTDRDSFVNIKKKIIKLLLNHGANVDAQTPGGRTALQFAIWDEFSHIVEVLLEYNANVNVRKTDSLATPLHIYAERKNVEICKILLNKGVDVDAVDCYEFTALHIATDEGSNEIVKLLLERGAKVDSKNKSNITPLYLSAFNGYQEIMETLLKSGADINFRTIDGDTALHIASQLGHNEVVTTLLEYGSDINITTRNNRTPLDYARTNITKGILKRHIVQMKTANLFVSQQNLLSVDEISFSDFQKKCESEITSMKSEKMNNYNISFYDILTKNTDSLAISLRNENIVQILKLDDYKTKFPIYGGIIKSRFRNGMKRKELLDQVNKILHFLYSFFANHRQLPQESIENIISYLSDEDLKIIIKKSKDK